MSCGAATSASDKDEPDHFQGSFRFGATSASVEADAAPRDSRFVPPEDVSEPIVGISLPTISSDIPPIPSSSPERSPSGGAVLAPPGPRCLDRVCLSPAGVSWSMYPTMPSTTDEAHLQSSSSVRNSSSASARLNCLALSRTHHPTRSRLLVQSVADPTYEDCTSDSSMSTVGNTFSAEHPQEGTSREACIPPKITSEATKQPTRKQTDQCIRCDSPRQLFWPPMNPKVAQRLPDHGNTTRDGTSCGSLQSHCSTPEAFRGQVVYPSPGGSPASCGSRSATDSSTQWGNGGTVTRGGNPLAHIEYLDDADDGRSWLEHLEKLRSGATKDEYKRERSRVVDALIRRAAAYPKVSGIYFDKHQVNRQHW